MNIGELIHNRRIELGLTLEQVGDAVGVGKSTVRKWETGYISNMRRDRISKLASVLHLDPADLIIPEQNQSPAPRPSENTVTLFGRDGSKTDRTLTEEQYKLILGLLDQMPGEDK